MKRFLLITIAAIFCSSATVCAQFNTVNPTLRKAAEEAARKARFNKVDGVNNQSGTITYYFKLK